MLVCLVGAWPPRAGLPSATMTSSLPSPRSLDSVLKKYPTKFIGCCLANPADDGSGLKQFEHLVLKDGCRAVRFNPYLWPSGEKVLALPLPHRSLSPGFYMPIYVKGCVLYCFARNSYSLASCGGNH